MHQHRYISLSLLLCCVLAGIARADSFQLNNGSTLSGDVVSGNDAGIRVRLPDGNYSDVISWTNFSQEDLKKMAKDPKLEQYATNFIEITQEERIQRTEVPNITQPPRLRRPAAGSFFGAMIRSSVGFFVLFVLYAAGIYAAFEVAIFRRRPKGLVCGLAAIPGLGLLSPIIFLSMPPPQIAPQEEVAPQPEGQPVASAPAASAPGPLPPGYVASTPMPGVAPESAAPAETGGLHLAHSEPPPPAVNLPKPEIFQRGAFMFNRRFFETKFPGFFGVVRRDSEKDMVLFIKAARGTYIADRISRIAANDMHIQTRKGNASEEVMVPFTEIQEVQYKHKDT